MIIRDVNEYQYQFTQFSKEQLRPLIADCNNGTSNLSGKGEFGLKPQQTIIVSKGTYTVMALTIIGFTDNGLWKLNKPCHIDEWTKHDRIKKDNASVICKVEGTDCVDCYVVLPSGFLRDHAKINSRFRKLK